MANLLNHALEQIQFLPNMTLLEYLKHCSEHHPALYACIDME